MITTPEPNVTDHHPMPADSPRPKTHRRRDDALSRDDAVRLIRKQVGVIIPPWGVFTAVGSGVALVISVMSFQSTTTQDKVDKNTAPLQAQIVEMDKRLTGRLDAVDKRLDRFGTRLDAVEGRLGALEFRVGAMDSRIQQIDAKLDLLLGK